MSHPAAEQQFTARIAAVARDLRQSLEEAVFAIAGVNPRPSALVQKLGLDKSLAGRIVRTVRAPNPLQSLHVVPAPTGLRMFVRAAAEYGVPAEVCSSVDDALRSFEQLIAEFPGGRTALDGAIAGLVPEARERGERTAKQAVFKAMSYLLGYEAEATLVTLIVQPSTHSDETCDVLWVHGRYGLRRLRVGEPLKVFGIRHHATPVAGAPQRPEPLDPAADPSQPASYLLSDYCSAPPPKLKRVEVGSDQVFFALGSTEPGVNVPVTLVTAQVQRQLWMRYRTPERPEEWDTHISRIPSRVLISDVFLRDDVLPDVEPVITSRMHGITTLPVRQSTFRLDEVRLGVETARFEAGARDIGTGEIPQYPQLVSDVFARAGWDRRRFRIHRLRVVYPVPFVAVTRWYALPERPAT